MTAADPTAATKATLQEAPVPHRTHLATYSRRSAECKLLSAGKHGPVGRRRWISHKRAEAYPMYSTRSAVENSTGYWIYWTVDTGYTGYCTAYGILDSVLQ